ncbi:MAG: alpha/beta hydrolase, partial [Neisseriaceae bacterium]
MSNSPRASSDLQGASRLAVSAIIGVADILEHFHLNLMLLAERNGLQLHDSLPGATRLGYRLLRKVTHAVGLGVDGVLGRLQPLLGEGSRWPGRETALAVLNGVLGDYLQAKHNPLAISMQLRRAGQALTLQREALAAAVPDAGGRVLLLIHGLCMNDLQWSSEQHNHGTALAAELGYTPLFLHYNSGLHISINGRCLSELLQTLQQ